MKSLNKIANWILILMLFTMLLFVTLQVLNRFVFGIPSAWTEELSRYLYIWLTFYGAVLVTRDKEHIQVDFLLKKFPTALRLIINKINTVLIIIFLLVFIYGGYIYTQVGLNSPLPTAPFIKMGYVVIIIPISGLLMTLIHVYGLFKNREDGQL